MRKAIAFLCIVLFSIAAVGCDSGKNTSTVAGHIFSSSDVYSLLKIPPTEDASFRSIPVAREGEVVVYYGGWNIDQLEQAYGEDIAWWYQISKEEVQKWPTPKIGYYRVVFSIPGTKGLNYEEQTKVLHEIKPDFEPAPALVAITAFLAHNKATHSLPPGRVASYVYHRCRETLPEGARAHIALEKEMKYPLLRFDYQHQTLAATKYCP
ncbi:hypothetical protein COU77_01720 [Candidatus Peregrinibacteria bacterium CG10_big_fil_rev_8_21_14_0_10_49_16]|nr:MAG: hypothetical protein COW95_01605 [Candidatus Peregrinibacteria bacterium CG22_combo_CG10-13_8_21_14_all_49_11]PIR52217.1 MAG: hypothetical protein COU77_01720 [Candidatus Peregrinibacteria bacterium CG10_big_fil_rev_8_21_14_0_10_49_16]